MTRIPSTMRLALALGGLVVLTVTSFVIAHVDTGAAGAPIAYLIAVMKAAIVVMVFMEVRAAGVVGWASVAVAIGFIALLCAGAVADVALR